MKSVHGGTKKGTFGLWMLMATLLFGSAVAKADVVLDWNVIAVDTAIASGQSPFAQARFAAIVQLAVFESVNAITRVYHPNLGTIVAPPRASADAAAIQAAYRVLGTYFPAASAREPPIRKNLQRGDDELFGKVKRRGGFNLTKYKFKRGVSIGSLSGYVDVGRGANDLLEMTAQFIPYLNRFQVKDGFL
jgi:hypothetical protein